MLMNVENEREETDMINKTEWLVQDVTRKEVKMALSKTSNGKACGSSEVSAELLKALSENIEYIGYMTSRSMCGTGERYQMVGERAKWYQYTKMRCYGVWKLTMKKTDGTCNEGPGKSGR